MAERCLVYRRREEMAKNKENKKQLENEAQDLSKVLKRMDDIESLIRSNEFAAQKEEKWYNKNIPVLNNLIVPLAVTVLSALFVFVVTDLNGTISAMERTVNDLHDADIESRLSVLETQMDILAGNVANSKATPVASIDNNLPNFSYTNDNTCEMETPTWKISDVIAMDTQTGAEYTAADLINKPILIPYTSGNQEVFFYGQFNVNNHWNGNCIINVYENDQLVLIMDAIYDDGTLISYKQVLSETTSGDGDVWVVSERTCASDTNVGETWNYSRTYDYPKTFETDDVSVIDIIPAEIFRSNINTRLMSYYNGNTSGGLYDDSTGNAYLVKYFEDGTVRTLYRGQFADGKFHDNTGEAWYITKDEDTTYMYFEGVFENNSAKRTDGDVFINPCTVEDIRERIAPYTFNCELKWAEE